jgi:hypothetical protein
MCDVNVLVIQVQAKHKGERVKDAIFDKGSNLHKVTLIGISC